MPLLERVATLLRANLNDLIANAEHPIKMMNQVILDMENQFLQLKTQVAIAVADQHLLDRKRLESGAHESDWVSKAELALQKGNEELARTALQRSLESRAIAKSFAEQLSDQRAHVENLKAALSRLDVKMAETRVQADLLAAQYRRASSGTRAASAQRAGNGVGATLQQLQEKMYRQDAIARAHGEMQSEESVEEQFAQMEKREEIDRLLAELKQKLPGS